MNALLEAALQYAARGWRVIPLHGIVDGGCTCRLGGVCETPGKHPRIKTGKDHGNASSDPVQVEAWWRRWPNANVGLTGFTVVDVDSAGGLTRLQELIDAHEALPKTLTARSGREGIGLHFYFAATDLRNSAGDGLDLRAAGGLVVAPPSRHASGKVYQWICEAEPAVMPDWLQNWFRTRKREQSRKGPDSFRETPVSPGIDLGARPLWLGSNSSAAAPVVEAVLRSLDPLPPWRDVAAAVALLPNPDVGWDAWNERGMLVYASTGGAVEGWEIFRRWSAQSSKHRDEALAERWAHWSRSPPTAMGFGSLVYLAREVEPGWEPPSRRKVAVDPHQMLDETLNLAPGLTSTKLNGGHALPAALTEPSGPTPLIKLNNQYAVIGDVGGKCLVLGWVPSKVDEALKVPSFQTFKSFSERYANQYIMTKHENSKGEMLEEPKQIGSYWLKWTGRRSFEGIELEPNQPALLPGNVMNLWSGFAVPAAAGAWPLMRRHILEVLAAGEREAADYIVKFAAWAVQHPGERAEAALVFRGGKGSGKGTFANAMRRLFGQHGLQLFNSKHMVGSFNGHLRNCLLLFADEAFWAGDKQGESVLKGMLTESVLMIEDKGVNAVQWRNRLHVIMAANAEWVVPASHDERRYAVFDVSNHRVNDRAYFRALYGEIASGGLGAMLWDLLLLPLGDWHPRDILHNRSLQEQKARSMDARHAWFEYTLQTGLLPRGGAENKTDEARAVNLYHVAIEFQTRHGEINQTNLGRFLREWKVIGWHTKDGSRWRFPPLGELRAAWEAKFGNWPWRENVGEWRKE